MLVSSEPQPSDVMNWLPAGEPGATGHFSLTLRLYNPKPLVYQQPEQLALPQIERGVCR
jgi:hypothetical protein